MTMRTLWKNKLWNVQVEKLFLFRCVFLLFRVVFPSRTENYGEIGGFVVVPSDVASDFEEPSKHKTLKATALKKKKEKPNLWTTTTTSNFTYSTIFIELWSMGNCCLVRIPSPLPQQLLFSSSVVFIWHSSIPFSLIYWIYSNNIQIGRASCRERVL